MLYGATRLGKTTWARSLGCHHYFEKQFSAGELVPDAGYAVFDDIAGGLKMFPGFKGWMGGQANIMIKKMYRDPFLIKWGRPVIWCCNSDPRHDVSPEDANWLDGNCVFVHLTSAIFHANT